MKRQTRWLASTGIALAVGAMIVPAARADWATSNFNSTGILGSGTGGGYAAGTDWTIVSNSVTPTGTSPNDRWRVGVSASGVVGPGTGSSTTALVVHNTTESGGSYTLTDLGYRDRLVFDYQDTSNYLYIDLFDSNAARKTPTAPTITSYNGNTYTAGGTVGTGAVVFGAVYQGKDNPLSVIGSLSANESSTSLNVNNQFALTWDPTANTIVLSLTGATGVTSSPPGTQVINLSNVSIVDPNFWESGQFGIMSAGSLGSEVDPTDASFTAAVPEPTAALMLGGVGLFGLLKRRKAVKTV